MLAEDEPDRFAEKTEKAGPSAGRRKKQKRKKSLHEEDSFALSMRFLEKMKG